MFGDWDLWGTGMYRNRDAEDSSPMPACPSNVNTSSSQSPSAASSAFITRASVLQAGASGPVFGVQQGKIRANPSPNSHFPCTQPDPSSAKPITPVLGSQQLRLWELLTSLPLLATKLQHGQLGAVLRQHAVTLPRKSSC